MPVYSRVVADQDAPSKPVGVPRNYYAAYTNICQFEADDFSGGSPRVTLTGNGTLDTSRFYNGVQSVRLDLPSDGTTRQITLALGTPVDLSRKHVVVWFSVDGVATDYSECLLEASVDSGFVKKISRDVSRPRTSQYPTSLGALQPYDTGPNLTAWAPQQWGSNGWTLGGGFLTSDYPNIAYIRLTLKTTGGVARSVWIDHIHAYDNPLHGQKGIAIIRADDGYMSQHDLLLPIMESRGVKCTVGFAEDWLDQSPAIGTGVAFMTQVEAADLIARGHEASVHGITSAVRDYSTQTQIEQEILRNKRQLTARGLISSGLDVYIYPRGEVRWPASRDASRKYFLASSSLGPGNANIFPPPEPHLMEAFGTTETSVNSAGQLNAWIAKINNDGVGIFNIHQIDNDVGGLGITQATLKLLLDALIANGILILPFGTVVNMWPRLSQSSAAAATVSTVANMAALYALAIPANATEVYVESVKMRFAYETSLSRWVCEAPLFGNGSGGDLTVASGTTTINGPGNYRKITVASGAILQINSGAADAIRCYSAQIDGTVTVIAAGGTSGGGAARTAVNTGAAGLANVLPSLAVAQAGSGAAGGGTTTKAGGAGGQSVGGSAQTLDNLGARTGGTAAANTIGGNGTNALAGAATKLASAVGYPQAQGGAGGGSGAVESIGTGGTTASSGAGGTGGSAGGYIDLYCGELAGAGSFTAPGANGNNGGNAIQSTNADGDAAGGGGGGGGGGGFVRLNVRDTTSWTGTLTAVGGTGGSGGSGVGASGKAGGTGGNGGTGITSTRTL